MTTPHQPGGGCPMNRRRFLQGLGAGAAASAFTLSPGVIGSAFAASPVDPELAAPDGTTPISQFFSRMFPDLPPFAVPSAELTAALLDIGRVGGVLDAKDDIGQGPILLITDPNLSLNNRDNPNHTAGRTFMGQFLDHDVTFDATSALGVPTEPRRTRNGRSPRFDLDSVYGSGPAASPQLYDPANRAKLRLESGGLFEDVPRAADMTAIVSDARNDENMMISGLQCAFIKFHNRVVDVVRSKATASGTPVFDLARRVVTG